MWGRIACGGVLQYAPTGDDEFVGFHPAFCPSILPVGMIVNGGNHFGMVPFLCVLDFWSIVGAYCNTPLRMPMRFVMMNS